MYFNILNASISDQLSELNDWGPIFTLWSDSEDKLKTPLAAFAKAVGHNYAALQKLVNFLPIHSFLLLFHVILRVRFF